MPEMMTNPVIAKMVDRLRTAVGTDLRSVVLYGSAARGDYEKATSDLNLLIVLDQLDPATLERLKGPVTQWERKGQPAPRIFSQTMMRDSVDVFPIEFLDLQASRQVLFGDDPFRDVEVETGHLRLQCEREFREKMMRLREAYIEIHDAPRKLTRLLTESYSTFVALFRGCLYLHGDDVPVHNEEVVAAFCVRADLDRAPFDAVAQLKHGHAAGTAPKPLFARYYGELTKAVARIDRFEVTPGGTDR